MNWHEEVRMAFASRGAAADPDVIEELAQHADAAFASARAEGLDPDAAHTRVRQLVGSWTADPKRMARRPSRPATVVAPADPSPSWTAGLAHDIRYGVRVLLRQPGFTAIAVLLIALGVGAATTLASLTYAVLLKPLPWPDSGRLVRIAEMREGARRNFPNILTNATFLEWRQSHPTLADLAAWDEDSMTITSGAPERVSIVRTTASLFSMLGARAEAGALFGPADEAPSNRALVISDTLWQRRFGRDPAAVGRTIDLDGETYRIVGVMAPEFGFPGRETEGWAPLSIRPVMSADPTSRAVALLRGIGRLAPHASVAEAAAEGTARGHSAPDLGMVGTAVFGTQGKPTINVTPYLDAITSDVRPALLLMLAAVVLLLVAAATNVAGMQLARATARRRELAIRAALGAGTGRLARQLLVEHLLIAAAGGLAGWLCALALYRAMPALLPATFPRLEPVTAIWRTLAIACGCALASSVAFGVVPTLLSRKLNLVEALTEDSLAPAGAGVRSRVGRLRALTMGAQVAIAALLLVGAALLGRTFDALLHVDRGYDPHHLLTATVPMPMLDANARAQALDDILQRLSHTPGVAAASAASVMPLMQYDSLMSFHLSPRANGEVIPVQTAIRSVGPGYFSALGIRVVDGRAFTDADTRTSEPVIVVNRAFLRAYVPDGTAGTMLPIAFTKGGTSSRIIGVVDDVKQRSATDAPQPELYNDYRQIDGGMQNSTPVIVARTAGDPEALAQTLRAIVQQRVPTSVIDSLMTMDDRLATSLAQPRLYAVLLGAFAGFCLLLAGAGLFSVLSYTVAQRHREIGVRSALGAKPRDIVTLVVRQTLVVAGAGALVGLGIALLVARNISSLFFGVTWRDPFSFAAVAVLLMLATTAACYGPARRAARVDPLKALRAR
jgi:putative ABC transport system permease protein